MTALRGVDMLAAFQRSGTQMALSDAIGLIQALISLFGFGAVAFSLLMANRNTKGATHDRVYAHYHNVCSIFVEHPELRPYFYSNKSDDGSNPALTAKIDATSEAILGLIEHAVVQRENMPTHSWERCWEPYARERVLKSDMLQQFFRNNRLWYTTQMQGAYDGILPSRSVTQ
jgi:hypothetical protein